MIVAAQNVGTQVAVWDAESSNQIANLVGHHQSVNCMAFVWIPTSHDNVMCSLVTCAGDTLVRFEFLWDACDLLRKYFEESDKATCGRSVDKFIQTKRRKESE